MNGSLKEAGMDKVFISGLQVQAVIGVYEWERQHAQPLFFDIEMSSDLSVAGKSDDLNDAINYAQVSDAVCALVVALQPQLIETSAEQVAAMILSDYPTNQVAIKISKPDAVPAASCVGVQITRTK